MLRYTYDPDSIGEQVAVRLAPVSNDFERPKEEEEEKKNGP